jgi:hypothetical protein
MEYGSKRCSSLGPSTNLGGELKCKQLKTKHWCDGNSFALRDAMNSPQMRPVPGKPILPITEHSYWPCCRRGPNGIVRPVVGAHSPFCGGPRISLPLIYTLKVIEPGSCRVLSSTRMAGPEEAHAALRLLGPTRLQPVLVSKSAIQFFARVS